MEELSHQLKNLSENKWNPDHAKPVPYKCKQPYK